MPSKQELLQPGQSHDVQYVRRGMDEVESSAKSKRLSLCPRHKAGPRTVEESDLRKINRESILSQAARNNMGIGIFPDLLRIARRDFALPNQGSICTGRDDRWRLFPGLDQPASL